MLWIAFLGLAFAYETDQITFRDIELADANDVAGLWLDHTLDEAIDRVNRRTSCRESDHDTRVAMAREIHRRTASFATVWDRGPIRMFGYGKYMAWLEKADIDRFDFREREDIYSEVGLFESWVLWWVGPCATICLAGQRLGTDKVDHFFGEGFTYFKKSGWGQDAESAVAWGEQTESGFFGLGTSGAYSAADLEANLDGYVFYTTLLSPGSIIQRNDSTGCLERVQNWNWARWIDRAYDEALNPPRYRPRVADKVAQRLSELGMSSTPVRTTTQAGRKAREGEP